MPPPKRFVGQHPVDASHTQTFALNYQRDTRDHAVFFDAKRRSRLQRGLPDLQAFVAKEKDALRTEPPPSSFSLLTAAPLVPVLDQQAYGSCTAHATCTAAYFLNYSAWIAGGFGLTPSRTPFKPSRMYQYNLSRLWESTPLSVDSGAYVFDACAVMERARVADELAFPYSSATFTQTPPLAAVKTALRTPWNSSFDFQLLTPNSPTNADIAAMKACLAQNQPLVLGFDVYDSAINAAGSAPYVYKLPSRSDALDGGHCVCIIGYDEDASHAVPQYLNSSSGDGSAGAFLVRNSWYWGTPGRSNYVPWAQNGNFWMSYKALKAVAYDVYVLV